MGSGAASGVNSAERRTQDRYRRACRPLLGRARSRMPADVRAFERQSLGLVPLPFTQLYLERYGIPCSRAARRLASARRSASNRSRSTSLKST